MNFSVRSLLPLVISACLLSFIACSGEETDQEAPEQIPEEMAVEPKQDMGFDPSPDMLLGSWRLSEMRIEGMEPITQQESYLSFGPEGMVTLSNPSDPELEDLVTEFSLFHRMLTFDDVEYEVMNVGPDSLILSNQVESEKVVNFYLRVDQVP